MSSPSVSPVSTPRKTRRTNQSTMSQPPTQEPGTVSEQSSIIDSASKIPTASVSRLVTPQLSTNSSSPVTNTPTPHSSDSSPAARLTSPSTHGLPPTVVSTSKALVPRWTSSQSYPQPVLASSILNARRVPDVQQPRATSTPGTRLNVRPESSLRGPRQTRACLVCSKPATIICACCAAAYYCSDACEGTGKSC